MIAFVVVSMEDVLYLYVGAILSPFTHFVFIIIVSVVAVVIVS